MINTTKFPSELSHHDSFLELSSLPVDFRHGRDIINADFFFH